jgi:hypothetical protein
MGFLDRRDGACIDQIARRPPRHHWSTLAGEGTMDDVLASVAGAAIMIALVLSGSISEALSFGHALGSWLNAFLPI